MAERTAGGGQQAGSALCIAALSAQSYRPHALHAADRIWPETNCYTDLLIEVLHAFGHEPLAMLPFTLAIDFEGDQWTFFKPPHEDLVALYGADVQELAIWRPVLDHVEEQVARGCPVLVELDSFYLPDTQGTAYRRSHAKTTVGVNRVDRAARRLGYFHNAGYYELEGDDFDELFLLRGLPHERVLPPYAELLRWREAPGPEALAGTSLELLRKHVRRLPRVNPFAAFQARFERDLGWLTEAPIEQFHVYSFANLRQYGACFELAASYLDWIEAQGRIDGLAEAARRLRSIAETAKAFQFQLARAMARRKPLDLAPIDAMGAAWQRAAEILRSRIS